MSPLRLQWKWLTIAVAVKLLYLGLFLSPFGASDREPCWVQLGGDAPSYLVSVDNLVTRGRYAYDLERPETVAGRMPGIALLYWPLRAALPQCEAQKGLLVVQASLDGIAAVLLGCTAGALARSRLTGRLTFLAYCASTFVSSWNHRGQSESLSATAVVLLVFLMTEANTRRGIACPLAAGIGAAWCVFLKPAMVVLLPVLAVCAVAAGLEAGRSGRSALRTGLLLLVPFLLADSLWISRNYQLLGRWIPLQVDENAGYQYSRSFLALVDFVKAWGGDYVSWNPSAEIRWFDRWAGSRREGPLEAPPEEGRLPAFVETRKCDTSRLRELRQMYLLANDPSTPPIAREIADQAAAAGLTICRDAFKEEHAFRHHVLAPARLLRLYLVHSGTYNLFGVPAADLKGPQLALKAAQSCAYALILAIGAPAAAGLGLFVAGSRRRWDLLAPSLVAAFFLFGYPVVLRRAENRYLVAGYPCVLLCAAVAASMILRRLRPGDASPVHRSAGARA